MKVHLQLPINCTDILVTIKVTRKEVSLMVKQKLKDRLASEILDETVALCLYLYTDDYGKKAFLDVHASWIDKEFKIHHAALAIRHFGTASHTGDNIASAVNVILAEYGLQEDGTPITTDHGANVVAALRCKIRLDCLCHRLHCCKIAFS